MILRNVIPRPASVATGAGELRVSEEAVLRLGAALSDGMIAEYKGLWNRFSLRMAELTVVSDDTLDANCAVLNAVGNVCPALRDEDEYALSVTAEGAFMRGADKTGLWHALLTLLQLIVPVRTEGGFEGALPEVEIHDHPAIRGMRAIHLCVFPETTLILLEKAIRLAGLMKFTHVVLEFWASLKYDVMPELSWPDQAYTKDELRPLVKLIHDLGMEPIPMLNHLGHASQSRCCYGKHVVLDQNPARALLFEPDGWTWCLSNPDTLKLLRAMRRELIELCGEGHYFHLGCDEAYSYATCPLSAAKDGRAMLAGYLNGLAEELGREGRRPIIWGDQLLDATAWPRPNMASSQPNQRTHEVLPQLDKRIVIADWQYDITEPHAPTAEHFMKAGFDTLLCPWDGHRNNEALGAARSGSWPRRGIICRTTCGRLPRWPVRAGTARRMSAMPARRPRRRRCCARPCPICPNITTRAGWAARCWSLTGPCAAGMTADHRRLRRIRMGSAYGCAAGAYGRRR